MTWEDAGTVLFFAVCVLLIVVGIIMAAFLNWVFAGIFISMLAFMTMITFGAEL